LLHINVKCFLNIGKDDTPSPLVSFTVIRSLKGISLKQTMADVNNKVVFSTVR